MKPVTELLKLKKLYLDAEIPQYATQGDAGFDLIVHNFKILYNSTSFSYGPIEFLKQPDHLILTPHSRVLVGSGFALEIPEGKFLMITSRSGRALREGLTMANGVGIIDSGYRGEIGTLLFNSSQYEIQINKGDRIGQAILMSYNTCAFEEAEELSKTQRGTSGFGSTGRNEYESSNLRYRDDGGTEG